MRDARHDGLLVGRSEELARLVRNIMLGRHTLLIGESGVGKTRLLTEARRILLGTTKRIECAGGVVARRGDLGVRVKRGQYRILFVELPAPLQRCVREMLELLFAQGDLPLDAVHADWREARQELSRLGAAELQSLVLEGIVRSSAPYIIFVDNLDRVTAAQQHFLSELLKIAVVCAASVQVKETSASRQFWASFERFPVQPLTAEESRSLVDHLLSAYAFRAEDIEMYRRELLEAGNGSPAAIRTMAWRSSRERMVSLAEIRSIRLSGRGRYFNMGPIYIFGIAAFTLMKIFSIGMDNVEFSIYFSALGFIAYLVFRVFRSFFVFRPQKQEPPD